MSKPSKAPPMRKKRLKDGQKQIQVTINPSHEHLVRTFASALLSGRIKPGETILIE